VVAIGFAATVFGATSNVGNGIIFED